MQVLSLIAILSAFSIKATIADVGGHDLFTSLAQLEVLWKNEMEVIELIKDTIEQIDKASIALKA